MQDSPEPRYDGRRPQGGAQRGAQGGAHRKRHVRKRRLPLQKMAIGVGLAMIGTGLIGMAFDEEETAPARARLSALDVSGFTVSGLSSGGFMAAQMHLIHSDAIEGAGIVAAGPYRCAEYGAASTLTPCMTGLPAHCAESPSMKHDCPDVASRATSAALRRAADAMIAPLDNLMNDRVYLFSGDADSRVLPAVVDQTYRFYSNLLEHKDQIQYRKVSAVGHTFPTASAGQEDCDNPAAPFISRCGLDVAGEILAHLHPDLEPPAQDDVARAEHLVEFDQGEFLLNPASGQVDAAWYGMAEKGYAYVPQACQQGGASCRAHVVFHGCKQSESTVGDLFARDTGYNRWAEKNALVILYPQAAPGPDNPFACWDWWGYTDAAWDTKQGRQVGAIKRMMERLSQKAGEDAS